MLPNSQKKFPRFVTLCGRIFKDSDPAYFPRLEYRGRTIYLCTETCREALRADPVAFYKAHRNSEKGKTQPQPASLHTERTLDEHK